MQAAPAPTLYDHLSALPEGLTGELLNGQLHTQPRPTGRHALAESNLQGTLGPPFGKGRGGPGGWFILMEPEVHFVRDTEVAVPDLAGWRRERMPTIPDGHRFEIAPDWVCEILSAGTASKDRDIKLPLYARHGVEHAWLIDPGRRTLEVLSRDSHGWTLLLALSGSGSVKAPPFQAVPFELSDLWD